MLTVSVIIVNWNTGDLLKDCLSSIPAGMEDLPFEVIVVDNASQDGSAALVKENFHTVRLLMNTENKGFAHACNQGAELAGGEYLFFLNPDTILQAGSVKRLVEFAPTCSWLGAVGPRLIGRRGKIQNSVRNLPRMKDILVRDTMIKLISPSKGKARLVSSLPSDRPSRVEQVSGAAFLIPRFLWQKLGAMDERFFTFYEEVDLCRRIRDMGYEIYYLPIAEVIHTGGGGRHQDRARTFFHSVNSMLLYLKKYEPAYKLFCFKLIYKPLFLVQILFQVNDKAKRDFIKKWLIEFVKS